MLIVFARCPCSAPFKSCFGEESVAEVLLVDFVGEVPCAVAKMGGGGRLHESCSVGAVFVVGVIESVDVDGQSACVFREFCASGYCAIAE